MARESTQRRSDMGAGAQQDLFGFTGSESHATLSLGVGDRQRLSTPRRGGGGYLNGRIPSELRERDPRLRELEDIGLAAHWLMVAREVGYDAFVAIWRALSALPQLRDDNGQVALTLRPIRAYERYQRNRYVESLVRLGFDSARIRRELQDGLGERLSKRHMNRLVAEYRRRHGTDDAGQAEAA
jgi:hypothetical protein